VSGQVQLSGRDLYLAGKLEEAIRALGDEVRDNPLDVRRRTFLFELLCFAGEYDRAEKQLEVLAGAGPDADLGAWLYRSALHADRIRQEMFRTDSYPRVEAPPAGVSGTLNGQPFQDLRDADPRIGARLEVFAAGQYTWIPFHYIAAIRMDPPGKLRDMLWAPARVQAAAHFQGAELGEVLLPAVAPLSWQDPDPQVRLGRVTEWVEIDGNEVPLGQKLLLVNGEESPILEIRELEIAPAPTPAH
jgi:type VI secretion system protein ImpE